MQDKAPAEKKPAKKNKRTKILLPVILLLLGVGLSGFFYHRHVHQSPIPSSLKRSVNFPIYYPDPKKLPTGYKLNTSSFTSPQNGVILYAIDYGQQKKVVFSEQAKPSDDEIQIFYSNYIPLRNELDTDLGAAQLGAHGEGKTLKNVLSLPVTGKDIWIIVTAPPDLNQETLKTIIASLKT